VIQLSTPELWSEEAVKLLQEILKWTRFEGLQRVKTLLASLLEKDVDKIVYQNSDGRPSVEIAKLAGVSHQTVVNYWKKWAKLGIVEPFSARGGTRYRRVFSLEDFGIDLPKTALPNPRSDGDKDDDQEIEGGS